MLKKGMLFLVVCLSMVLGAAEVRAAGTVTYNGKVTYGLTKVGNFTVNGQQAFCIEHEKESPLTDTSYEESIYDNADMRKVLYYGWNGPAQWGGFEGPEHGIVATSIVLSHYYSGSSVSKSSQSFYNWLQTQPAVPSAELSLSTSSTEAYLTEDKTMQRTEEITLNGSPNNYITMTVPEGIVLHNVTKGTEGSGSVSVNGGDTIYLTAPLGQEGSFETGALKGAAGNYQPVVCVTASDSVQNLAYGVWDTDSASTVSLTVKWVPHGKLRIEKTDSETGRAEAQGSGSLEGAVYEVYDAVGTKRETLSTDAHGAAETGLLPYDTYTVKEITASKGYLVSADAAEAVLNADMTTAAVKEQIIRADIKGVKAGSESHKRLAGVPFEIASVTTGEKHTVVSDANGEFSTAADWIPHTQNTNAGQTSGDGVWFGGGEPDDSQGALPYDTYTVTELPCEANDGYVLIPPFEVAVYRDGQTIDLGTLIDKSPEVPAEEQEISIHTSASNKADGKKTVAPDGSVTIVDVVEITGLEPGKTYRLTGWEMVKEENAELIVDGERVESDLTFTAEEPEMEMELEFAFNAAELGGSDVVIFEELYEEKDGEEPELVAEHKDINNTEQTVTVSEKPEEPAAPASTPAPTPRKSVKTGDEANLMVLVILLILSCAAALVCVTISPWRRTRRRQHRRK